MEAYFLFVRLYEYVGYYAIKLKRILDLESDVSGFQSMLHCLNLGKIFKPLCTPVSLHIQFMFLYVSYHICISLSIFAINDACVFFSH